MALASQPLCKVLCCERLTLRLVLPTKHQYNGKYARTEAMKRKEEEASKMAFDQFLRTRSDNPTIIWDDVVKDPPDYYLHLDGQKFAVEVTQIMETREINSEKLTLLE